MDASSKAPPRDQASRLLQAARQGENDARGQLLQLYSQYLLAVATTNLGRLLRRKVRPSDVLQETLLRVDRNFASFQHGSVREWEAWLRTLALNTIADLQRRFTRQKRDVRQEIPLDGIDSRAYLNRLSTLHAKSADRAAEDDEAVARAMVLVGQLRPSHQAVILWHFRDGLTVAEIALKLDRSDDAVRMLLNRALDALQKRLRNFDER